MDDFQDQVRASFKACKGDIENLKVENSTLRDKFFLIEQENRFLKEENKKANLELNDLKAEIKGIKIALDYIKDFSRVSGNGVSEFESSKVSEIEEFKNSSYNTVSNNLESISKQQKIQKQQDPYEALLAFKAKANKREMLKQKIMSMIGENGMNLSELKFMFVEHFRYCSKASFYNYLKELEIERIVKIERENSKNFIYLMTHSREI